jgi:hypothetical protein
VRLTLTIVAALVAVPACLASPALAAFTYSSEFGGPGTAPGNIGIGEQLAIGPSGTIYVGDSDGNSGHNAIDEYNQQGSFLGTIGPVIPGYPGGSSNCSGNPAWCFLLFYAGVAADSAGDIYVADNGNSRVIKLDPNGNYLATIGPAFMGASPSTLGRPTGLAVQGSNLFVADPDNSRVVEFTTAGTFVRTIGGPATGTPGHGTFTTRIFGVALDSAGNIYVSDAGSQLVQKFNSAGVWLTQWGSQTPTCTASSSADGCLGGGNVGPQQLTIDASGNVFVTDSNHYQIQEFTSDGTYITKFGAVPGCPPVCPTEPQQLVDPAGIATVQVGGSTEVLVSDSSTDFVTTWIPAAAGPPPPVLGQSVDVVPVSGVVFVKPPPGLALSATADPFASAAIANGSGFVALTRAQQIPSGSQIDARAGTLALTAAPATARGQLQTGSFGGGLFKLAQDSHGQSSGLTTLSLLEGAFQGAPSYASCKAKKAGDSSGPGAHAAKLSSRVLQTLHASVHGRFRTHGRYSAATVRGTAWTTSDRCDGTLTSVQRGRVQVSDFARHITVIVRQGHRYLARAHK